MQLFVRSMFLVLLSAATFLDAYAQDRTITGKVTSAEDNAPIPGASVVVQGTTRGTTTDASGNFRIQASKGQTLRVSFIGTTNQDITVGNADVINVVLKQEDNALNEVVVTALGIKQEKRSLGYAVSEVKGAELAETQRENFLTSLQGRVPGLQMSTTSGLPGASVQIQLRGVNSIGGDNSPLFVVDGLPINNSTFSQGALVSDGPNRNSDYLNRAADINPNDIESISVLKGPEAAALYGINAAAGAIIITTKKGKAGRSNVSYDNVFRVDHVYRYPKTQTVYGRGVAGTPSPTALSFLGPKYPEGTPIFDNPRTFFRDAFTQRHNLTFDGGTEKLTYRASSSFTDAQGTIPNTGSQILNLSLNLTSTISSKLEITPSLQYTSNKIQKQPAGTFGYLINLLTWPANDDISTYLNQDGSRRRIVTEAGGELDNPLFNVNRNQSSDQTNRTIGRLGVKFDPTSWLNITGRIGTDLAITNGNNFIHPETNEGLSRRGAIENYTQSSRILTSNVLTTIRQSFGSKIKTSLLLGGDLYDSRELTTATYGENVYIPDYNSSNNTDPISRNHKLTILQRRVVSLLGQFTFGYGDLVYLTVTGRNDWTSTMPIQSRSFFYPSVSGSFVLTELPGLQGNRVVSFAKLRASYAEVGKDARPYRVLSSLTTQTTTGGGFGYNFYAGNPNLKPEFGKSMEIGGEVQLYNGRLGLDLAYYDTRRIDQIVEQRLSYGTGFVFGLLNGGSFSTKGIEFALTGKPIKTADFSWDVIANFSRYRTAVLTLPAANVPEYYNSDTWLYGNIRASAFVKNVADYFPEQSLRPEDLRGAGSALAFGGYDYLRNAQGQILINPSTGLPITNTNFLPIGDRTPDFTIGLTNSFRYKNLSLSFLLDIRKGGDVFNGNEMYMFRTGLSRNTLNRDQPVVFSGVLRDGKENTATPTVNTVQVTPLYRSDYFSALPESAFIERDINWMRLRDLTLNYTFPAQWLDRTKVIRRVGVFVTGTDLFLLTNYTGADPNVNGTTATSQGAGAAGFDFGKLAVPRGLSFGIRVGF
ncbi:SusC/RagA family TonB-linked outer membrane protein [Spirosoma soli]|uniref:SusC/RagA family TonB-linked outer membrane protein n=1 Tax=Spirosoma soli TaxID=1770529 RepID=A0ABW5LZ20_9BACT